MTLNSKYYRKGFGLLSLMVVWSGTLNVLSVNGIPTSFQTEYGKEIIKYAKTADIKSWMNPQVDPCDDFYKFSCGNWHRINNAQKGNVNTDKFLKLSNGIERRLQKILQKINSLNNTAVEHKIQNFHHSCLLTKNEKKQYLDSLSEVYKEFGEFSAFKDKEEEQQQQLNKTNTFKWWSTVAKILNRYGKAFIISIDIFDDFKDKSKTNMAYIGRPQFSMIVDYEAHRIKQFLQMYLKIDPAIANKMAENIVGFEKALKKPGTDTREGKSIEDLVTLYNTTDLHEKYADLFDVREYLELALGTKRLPPQVYIFDESYFEGLYEIFNSTKDEVVLDYILWLFLDEFLVDITQKDMEEGCIYETKKYFGKFIDHVIYNQYRSNKTEADIFDVWEDIKEAFKHNLQSDKYYWMSKETREEALKKLANMDLSINSYDDDNFIELFKDLDIDPNNYVWNVKNILLHTESMRENKLEKKTDPDTQTLSFTPNYNILDNQIKIPVSLLQPYYVWDDIYPKAILYGTLGYFLAHEMIHGFDDEGRKYDPNGQAHNWWDEKSAYEFDSRRICFKEQYHQYEYDGRLLPESDSQSENIADNGGINIAYDAYKLWLRKHGESNETLPRLEFNNSQLFFVSFAQLWCEDVLPEYKSHMMNTDVHAPAVYRVIGTLSNSREFTWLFKCDTKPSLMNPPKKCEIY